MNSQTKDTALVIIDMQNDYYPGGIFELPNIARATQGCRELLAQARICGIPVVHVRHESSVESGMLFAKGTRNAEIYEELAPLETEAVVVKEHPNSFRETDLQDILEKNGCRHLVIAGAMSQMCVDATTRAALDKAYAVTLCHDAVAAQKVSFQGVELSAEQVNAAFLSALAMAQVSVACVKDVTEKWRKKAL